MSIIKGLVGNYVREKAIDTAIDVGLVAAGTAATAFEEATKFLAKQERRGQERHWKKMMEKNPQNRHLWMTEEFYEGKLFSKGYQGYAFFDDEQALQYVAKSTRAKNKTTTVVYDGDKSIIAALAEVPVRKSIFNRSSNQHHIRVGIEIGGEVVGEIRDAHLTKKGYLTMSPVNWNAVHNGMSSTRIIDYLGQEKAEITQKRFARGSVTFLDCAPEIDELWIVLYALGLEIYEQIE